MSTLRRTARARESTSINIGIVGAGGIGANFAIVFALAGYRVRIYDPAESQRQSLHQRMSLHIADLAEYGLIECDADSVLERVESCEDLGDAIVGSDYVQECAPEDLALKRSLWREMDQLAPQTAVLASASSAILASEFAAGLPGARRCLVAHPGNPPTLLPVVELVPARFTDDDIVNRASTLLRSAGLMPIVVTKEVKGFVFNRLQGALLREAYCLVRDDVCTVDDVDRIVRHGLGLRWSVVGPFETADLNRPGGVAAHAAIMGDAYAEMGAERGQHDPWNEALVRKVTAQRRAILPLDGWPDRVRWRDRQLMATVSARRTSADD